MPERSIRVELGRRGYDVRVGEGLLDRLGEITLGAGAAPGSRAFMVCDDGLPPATVARAKGSLTAAGLLPTLAPAHAAETEKSLATLEPLLAQMSGLRLDRLEAVIALGGGIVGDLAGFAAAVYRRGVPVIQCPTTLLAMVDASVGGKTGVNLSVSGNLKKNMVGSFHQPRAVIADVSVLGSLPERVFRAGLAECLKHGMIAAGFGDAGLFGWTVQNLDRIGRRETEALVELIARNIAVKAAVVGHDEREEEASGGRALLNLGHTFAHAIETLPDLAPGSHPAPLQHGEAVALGLVAASRCAAEAGLCTSQFAATIAAAVERAGLPISVRGLPPNPRVLELIAHDKKVLGGNLRLILPAGFGGAKVVESPALPAITAGIDAIRA